MVYNYIDTPWTGKMLLSLFCYNQVSNYIDTPWTGKVSLFCYNQVFNYIDTLWPEPPVVASEEDSATGEAKKDPSAVYSASGPTLYILC